MGPRNSTMGRGAAPGLALLACINAAAPAWADGATRDLPETYAPGILLSVSIQLDAPPDTTAMGLEDVPPAGWTEVTAISDGGTYDAENHKVKWPPFFDNFSRTVSYDVTPLGTAGGLQCFSGYVSIDGAEQPTAGDECVSSSAPVPAASGTGLVVMALLLLVAATLVLRGSPKGARRST